MLRARHEGLHGSVVMMDKRWFENHAFKFEATPEEAEKIKDWIDEHRKACKPSNVVGMLFDTNFYVKFTPTGCGDIVSVGCSACKAQETVTNVKNF
jgi:hypothetical protein